MLLSHPQPCLPMIAPVQVNRVSVPHVAIHVMNMHIGAVQHETAMCSGQDVKPVNHMQYVTPAQTILLSHHSTCLLQCHPTCIYSSSVSMGMGQKWRAIEPTIYYLLYGGKPEDLEYNLPKHLQ